MYELDNTVCSGMVCGGMMYSMWWHDVQCVVA